MSATSNRIPGPETSSVLCCRSNSAPTWALSLMKKLSSPPQENALFGSIESKIAPASGTSTPGNVTPSENV